jgi:acetylornithine deacetylase/succinyl-diaminopimelate desuccinylase-like protein
MQYGALAALKENRDALNRDVWFAALIDEEKGSVFGAAYLAGLETGSELFVPGAVVISEGGGFPVKAGGREWITVTAGEKGFAKVRLFARGGDSAVKVCAALGSLFGGMETFAPVQAETQRRMERALGRVPNAEDGTAFDLYRYAGKNTAGTKEIHIGEQLDRMHTEAEVVVDCKVLPGLTQRQLEEYLQGRLERSGVEWTVVNFEAGFENPADALAEFSALAAECCAEQRFHCGVMPMLALGRTDGRFFGSRGCVVYGFSPLLMDDSFQGTLKCVHGVNESIGADSFRFGCAVMESLCLRLAGAASQNN